jgi:hypothetical protein
MPKKPKTKSPKNETLQLIREVAQGEPPVGLMQTKALRAMILLAQGAGFARGTIYSCPVEVLRDLLACRNDEVLRQELMALRGRTWNWPGLSTLAGWVSPIPALRWEERAGVVEWEISAMFLRALEEQRLGWIRAPWALVSGFSSQYALRIWELAMASHYSGRTTETRIFTLAELRETLGVPADAYRGQGQTGAMLHFCVRRPLKEVLELTGLSVNFIRRGRGEGARYWFRVEGETQPRQTVLPETVARQVRKETPGDVNELRQHVQAAIDGLPSTKRREIERDLEAAGFMTGPPVDALELRAYAGRLRGLGVLP